MSRIITVGAAQLGPIQRADARPQAVKRLLEPSEVAAAAAWLLGPDGRAVTGTPLVLDLGWTSH